jgi:hypothetical protein
MAQVHLVPNKRQLQVPVTLGNGKKITMELEPNEALIDKEGYVRFISRRYDDGVIGNFTLLPHHKDENKILHFIVNTLAGLGLAKAGKNIKALKGGNIATSVVLFVVGEYVTGPIIDDIFEHYTITHSGYYAMDTGELVIAHPIRV